MSAAKMVLCSHRNIDKPEVEASVRRLLEAGIDASLDTWEVSPGDDIVAGMNQAMKDCEVGLVFFSNKPWAGHWFGVEVNMLTVFQVAQGCRVIPVMIDAGAPVPALIRPFARRSIEDFSVIVDAILGIKRKPGLDPAVQRAQALRFNIQLERPRDDGSFDIVALTDGMLAARQGGACISSQLQDLLSEFMQGRLRDGAEERPATVPHPGPAKDRGQFGEQLGALLFAGDVAQVLRQAPSRVSVHCTLDLQVEVEDAGLLAQPFEAVRLGGQWPALWPGVVVRRVVRSSQTPALTVSAASLLEILVAVGAPDEGKSPNAELDLERELQGILDAVEPSAKQGSAEVRFLEVRHPEEIRKALLRDPYPVLHLSGHGGDDNIEPEDEDGHPVTVTARQLAKSLIGTGRSVPLNFLSSCHGAAASADSSALAADLVREGGPFMLAMQTRDTDSYAAALAQAFYRELCASPDRVARLGDDTAEHLCGTSAGIRRRLLTAETGRSDLCVELACTLLHWGQARGNEGVPQARQAIGLLASLYTEGRLHLKARNWSHGPKRYWRTFAPCPNPVLTGRKREVLRAMTDVPCPSLPVRFR